MLENHFDAFRQQVIGINSYFESPYGRRKIIYADWTASGRAYAPIEKRMKEDIMPLLGNTHTSTTVCGSAMTLAYEEAKQIIKNHVGASPDDILIFTGSGMTGAVNKLQRLLGLRIPERIMDYVKAGRLPSPDSLMPNGIHIHQLLSDYLQLDEVLKPVVFVSQMEHHSNQTSWIETIADVEILPNNAGGNIDLAALESMLQKYAHRQNKITAITGCSNVTGIQTSYHQVAQITHAHGGICFVDFACSAPYIQIDMHPPLQGGHLDAIYFSPHKFLGGQGTPGVLLFHRSLYHNLVPDQPGGGTVVYTNPWKYHEFIQDIEQREDGGTPPFLQGIKAGLAVKLKEQMGVNEILARESFLSERMMEGLSQIKKIHLLESGYRHRLAVFSFTCEGLHHNLFVKLLNDRFGIQARGGCACAGTYGHALLRVDEVHSYAILDEMHKGHMFCKPGWVRISLHPVMTNEEIDFIIDAVEQVAAYGHDWARDYKYDENNNEFQHVGFEDPVFGQVNQWFHKPFS